MTAIGRGMAAGAVAFGLSLAAVAGEADVVGARAVRAGDTYSFDVTVAHADAGWDHYADRWDVVAPDGSAQAYGPVSAARNQRSAIGRDAQNLYDISVARQFRLECLLGD